MQTKCKKKLSLKPKRIFSEPLKRQIVKEIETGAMNMAGICREYHVSDKAVYNWLNQYSLYLKSSKVIVVQMESEEQKKQELIKQVHELQRVIGQKQLQIDFLEKMIERGKEELGVDLKKKFSTPPSTGLE